MGLTHRPFLIGISSAVAGYTAYLTTAPAGDKVLTLTKHAGSFGAAGRTRQRAGEHAIAPGLVW